VDKQLSTYRRDGREGHRKGASSVGVFMKGAGESIGVCGEGGGGGERGCGGGENLPI
jgi:hypothetical protein